MAKRRQRPWRLPPGVEQILREAQETNSSPKQHHLVPKSYLRRWAEADVLKVTVLDEHRAYVTSPAKAAREAHFYRVESPELDAALIPPLLGETLLSKLEDIARPLMDKLVSEPDLFSEGEKAALALFISTQFTRGVAHRQFLEFITTEYYRISLGDLSDDGVRRLLEARAGDSASDDQIEAAKRYVAGIATGNLTFRPRQATSVAMALQYGAELAPLLYERPWVIYETSPILVTTDEPVLPVGDPDGLRDQRAGVRTAGVVLFPLAPDRLLVMPQPGLAEIHIDGPISATARARLPLDTLETTQVNRELIAHAHRWAFERPGKGVALRLAVPLQPDRERFENVGSRTVNDDGTESQLVRWFSPNRWFGAAEVPALPVSWWWP